MRNRMTKPSRNRREMIDRAAAERAAARLNLRPATEPDPIVRPLPSDSAPLTLRRAKKLMKARTSQATELAAGQMQSNERSRAGLVNFARRRAAEDSMVAERNAEMDRRNGGRAVIVNTKPE
jgi:hypothetical protein